MSDGVRLALFGAGLIGRRHLSLADEVPGCAIVAVCDVTPAAGDVAARHGASFYREASALLEAECLDGAIIATPNAAHADVGVAVASARLPMLVEKPLADTLSAGRRLLEAAAAANVPVAVGHHRRFDPSVERAKALLDAGDIGDLTALQVVWALRKHDAYYDTTWRTQRATGGGPGLINLIHDIDLMRHFAGDIERVYAELGRGARGLEVEDSIAATVRFRSGAVGTILSSDATPSPWGWEQGSGENPDVPKSAKNCYRLFGTRAALALPRLERHAHTGESEWRVPLAVEALPHPPRAALRAQLSHFCAVVRGECAPRVTGADGFASLAAALAITMAGERGEVVWPEEYGRSTGANE